VIKVVGVGSVGTVVRCRASSWPANRNSLFLQIKEAGPPSWNLTLGRACSRTTVNGSSTGCRLMQSPAIFSWLVGRTEGPAFLRSPAPGHEDQDPRRGVQPEHDDTVRPNCAAGLSLALTPAPASPQKSAVTLVAVTNLTRPWPTFPIAYADQSERDHKLLLNAVRDGRIEVSE